MILGKLTGKVTTTRCSFEASAQVKNFEYVKIYHEVYDYVLCQVVVVHVSSSGTQAICNILGHKSAGRLKPIRIPFDLGTEVLLADDDFVKEMILRDEGGAFLGKLEGRDIDVRLDLRDMLTKHVSVLAKSGAGKSYTVGVLLEEILESGVPVLIIDPHGEHHSLKQPSSPSPEERTQMATYGIEPKGYEIAEFSSPSQHANTLKLSNKLTRAELMHMLPKLSTTQQGLLYQAIRNSEHTNFDELLLSLEAEESMAKWGLINLIEGLRNSELFSSEPTAPHELIKPARAGIINLKGYAPDIQELIVYKLASDLFAMRKRGEVPPFFLVIEEAHNYCPERSFGESASSKILRTIASEGRKFGLGLCIVSQRPARVDKSVLSQCTTQLILKMTNPGDLKAVGSSVEGITAETEAEIKNLSIGTVLATGVTDLPLLVQVRPRRTAHGGVAIDLLSHSAPAGEEAELLPVLLPSTSPKDLKLMSEEPVDIVTTLRPLARFTCRRDGKDFVLLIDLTRNEILLNLEGETKKLPAVHELNKKEQEVLRYLFKNKRVSPVQMNIPAKVMQRLLAAGYVSLTGHDVYTLSKVYHYKKLEGSSISAPITYERIAGKRLKARFTLAEARALLTRSVDIIQEQECYLVHYKPVKATKA